MNNLKSEKGTQIYHSSVERDLSSFLFFTDGPMSRFLA